MFLAMSIAMSSYNSFEAFPDNQMLTISMFHAMLVAQIYILDPEKSSFPIYCVLMRFCFYLFLFLFLSLSFADDTFYNYGIRR